MIPTNYSEYNMKAHWTHYKGVNYRSRLEARWAAMFDLLGWDARYEPMDLDGWSPDFVLLGHRTVHVEVKPIYYFDCKTREKMDKACHFSEFLIVGAVCPVKESCGNPCIGWASDGGGNWALAPFGRWDEARGAIGFCHENGEWQDRISGGYDGGHFGNGDVKNEEILDLWKRAGNIVQYKVYNNER